MHQAFCKYTIKFRADTKKQLFPELLFHIYYAKKMLTLLAELAQMML